MISVLITAAAILFAAFLAGVTLLIAYWWGHANGRDTDTKDWRLALQAEPPDVQERVALRYQGVRHRYMVRLPPPVQP